MQIKAQAVLHQEGIFGLVALIALFARKQDLFEAFSPRGPLLYSLLIGCLAGLFFGVFDRFLAFFPPALHLENFQAEIISGWSWQDAVAVGLLSGLAEEALFRVFLQSWVGIFPAAFCFAVLHIVPDRRLWFWPAAVFGMGIILGLLFEYRGFPAAATAHMLINIFSFLRLLNIQSAESDSAG